MLQTEKNIVYEQCWITSCNRCILDNYFSRACINNTFLWAIYSLCEGHRTAGHVRQIFVTVRQFCEVVGMKNVFTRPDDCQFFIPFVKTEFIKTKIGFSVNLNICLYAYSVSTCQGTSTIWPIFRLFAHKQCASTKHKKAENITVKCFYTNWRKT